MASKRFISLRGAGDAERSLRPLVLEAAKTGEDVTARVRVLETAHAATI